MISINIQENVKLAPYTTMKIGGRARFFVRAVCENDVVDAVNFARSSDHKLFILGGGSNVLISDVGFDGVVIQIGITGVESSSSPAVETRNSALLSVGAGENWDEFVALCVRRELAGIECLSGIPGFVGGTPVQNVGAYGQEVSESIVSVRCFDLLTDKFTDLENAECGFAYRTSIFNSGMAGRYIVTGVTFSLEVNGEPKVTYKDLRDSFVDHTPSLGDVRDAVLKIRRAKSMVIDDTDPNSKSVGSFFKNPIVSKKKFESIAANFETVPGFAVDHEKVKIPAAWLIENSGFPKGYAIGEAGISSNHTLAIVNRGAASAQDILGLKDEIQKKVETKFGIELTPEPVFVGF